MRLVRHPLRGRRRPRLALLFALVSAAALRPTPAAAQSPTNTWTKSNSTLLLAVISNPRDAPPASIEEAQRWLGPNLAYETSEFAMKCS